MDRIPLRAPEPKNDPLEFREGSRPSYQRGCTDILCCLIFVLFWAGLFLIAFMAIKQGNPKRLAQPYDVDHKACGQSPGYENYNYIYFAYPSASDTSFYKKTVCLKKCPTGKETELECKPNSVIKSCKQDPKSLLIYETTPFFGRICLPKAESITKLIRNVDHFEKAQGYLADIQSTWKVILGSADAILCRSINLDINFFESYLPRPAGYLALQQQS
eukprot:TRINITY_DN4696_c0_g1_i14.p1 TRINITY_DN4696_c0_g1~~TRINITY_DN4696_c0_g1_i14.p1  ORF type:complete len:217 (+),score=31.55 TRINITY_DN4696_c0_g1_i14:127-777(+)